MAADTYFRQAATALRNAGREKLREADELRRQLEQQEAMVKQRTNDTQKQIRQTESHIAASRSDNNNDSTIAARLANDLNQFRKYIGDEQDKFDRLRVQMQERVRELGREVDDLNSLANRIESRA